MTNHINFLDELEKVAKRHDKKGMRQFINSHYSDDTVKFINDLTTQKVKSYTKEDWDNISKLAETNRGIRKLLVVNSVPKEIFLKFNPTFKDYANCLQREDLTNDEIKNMLSILGADNVKKILAKGVSNVSPSVLTYLVNLPNEKLKKYDYIPLSLMSRDINGFDEIEEHFIEKYNGDEDAMTQIINNGYMSGFAKTKAFEQGYNLAKLCNPPKGEICATIYETLVQTLFEFDKNEYEDAHKESAEKLIDLIKKDLLPYPCQIDLVERYWCSPVNSSINYKIIRELAIHCKIDAVCKRLAMLGDSNIYEIVLQNPYAGVQTFKIMKTFTRSLQAEKALFLEFFSHGLTDAPLYMDIERKAYEWNDKNLQKLLATDFRESRMNIIQGGISENEFYFKFCYELNNIIKDEERTKVIALHMLTCDKEFSPNYTKTHGYDATKTHFINIYDLNHHISKKYKKLVCLTEQEMKDIDIVLEKCREIISKNTFATKKVKENQFETIKRFKDSLNQIYEKETIFRKYNDFFISDKNSGFSFNIFNLTKIDDKKISDFIKDVTNTDDVNFLINLKNNLLERIVDSVDGPDSLGLIIATHKCKPVFDALDEKIKEITDKEIEKLNEELNR